VDQAIALGLCKSGRIVLVSNPKMQRGDDAMRRALTSFVLIAASFFIVVPGLHAKVLNGQTVYTLYFRGVDPHQTNVVDVANAQVGHRNELPRFGGFLDINFSDTNISITARGKAPASSFEMVRFSPSIPITSVTIGRDTNVPGFDASRIHVFGGQVIDVNLTGLPKMRGNQHISLDIK
jgi:hypothetical protein